MSWHYSQELEGAFLPPSICSDIGLSAPSKTRASARKSSCKDSETDCSPTSPSGTMQKPSTENPGEGTSTSSAPVFHVLRTRMLACRGEPLTSEIFGPTQCESFAKFDPESSTLRTYPDLFPVALSSVSSKTLPKQGMMRAGVCYLLPRPWWERTIYASGGGAERPWLESDGGEELWRTPNARDYKGASSVADGLKGGHAVHLNDQVRDNPFPTPTAGDSKASGAAGYSTASGRHSGTTLTDKVVRSANSETPREEESWPTPAANEDAAGTPAGNMQGMLGNHPGIRGTTPEEWKKGALSASWTDWLIGFPILWSSPDPLPVSAVQEWLAITLLHDWWAEEPPIPRVIERGGDKHRCRRLKGIGNAQVPLCAAVAYTILEIQQEASGA
jgi:hypothetical protein